MNLRWPGWMIAMLVGLVVAGLVVVGRESSLTRRSADFTIVYAAALLTRDGHPEAVYQPDQLGPLMLRISDNAIDPRLPFDAPFALVLPFVPLTFLPLETAFHVWQLLSLALLGFSLVLLERWVSLGRRELVIALLALAGLPATWALLSEGQSSALLLLGAALLVGAWVCGSARLAVAGAVLLALKPQYLPVYLILIAGRRQWRALAAALLGSVIVGLSPLLAGGPNGLVAMVGSALAAGQGWLGSSESLIGTLAPLLPSRFATVAGFVIWGIALGVLAVTAVRARGSMPVAALATAMAILFSPHALPYDTVLLVLPAWLGFSMHRAGAIPNPALAYLVVALALLVDLGRPLVSLAPIVLVAGLLWYGRYFWLRRQRPPAVPVAA
jgi:glycosyl transferase family 87